MPRRTGNAPQPEDSTIYPTVKTKTVEQRIVEGGPADGPHYERLQRIQEATPPVRDVDYGDDEVAPYSESRWAGHDFTPELGDNPVARRLNETQGLETTGTMDLEAKPDPDPAAVLISPDDPSGPDGGDLSADPQASVNWWGVVGSRDDDGRITRVHAEPSRQDEPAGPDPLSGAADDEDRFATAPASEQGLEDEHAETQDTEYEDEAPILSPRIEGGGGTGTEAEVTYVDVEAEHGTNSDQGEHFEEMLDSDEVDVVDEVEPDTDEA